MLGLDPVWWIFYGKTGANNRYSLICRDIVYTYQLFNQGDSQGEKYRRCHKGPFLEFVIDGRSPRSIPGI